LQPQLPKTSQTVEDQTEFHRIVKKETPELGGSGNRIPGLPETVPEYRQTQEVTEFKTTSTPAGRNLHSRPPGHLVRELPCKAPAKMNLSPAGISSGIYGPPQCELTQLRKKRKKQKELVNKKKKYPFIVISLRKVNELK